MKSRREYLSLLSAGGSVALSGCATLNSGGTAGPDIPPEAYPPGVGPSGITNAALLFETHVSVLEPKSYTYKQTYSKEAGAQTHEVRGSESAGENGVRYQKKRETIPISRPESPFSATYTGEYENWNGSEMARNQEYERSIVQVTTTDPDAYNETTLAERYPIGKRTKYSEPTGNSLIVSQQNYIAGTTLDAGQFEPTAQIETERESRIELRVTGWGRGKRGGRNWSAEGRASIRSDGLIRHADLEVTDGGTPIIRAKGTIEDVGERIDPEKPAWVAEQYGS
jgi:hypothetical protein